MRPLTAAGQHAHVVVAGIGASPGPYQASNCGCGAPGAFWYSFQALQQRPLVLAGDPPGCRRRASGTAWAQPAGVAKVDRVPLQSRSFEYP